MASVPKLVIVAKVDDWTENSRVLDGDVEDKELTLAESTTDIV